MGLSDKKLDTATRLSHNIVLKQGSNQTKGSLLQMEVVLQKGASAHLLHVHPVQEERILIFTGRLCCIYQGKKIFLNPGESINIMPGEPHQLINYSNEPVTYIQEMRPALDYEHFINDLLRCIQEKNLSSLKSFKGWFHYMHILQQYKKEIQLAGEWRKMTAEVIAKVANLFIRKR